VTTNLAGVDSGVTPISLVVLGSAAVTLAALVAGVGLRRVPGVPALCFGLGTVALFPIAWHVRDFLPVSAHNAPVFELLVIGLEVIAAASIVVSVFQIRRAGARHEPRQPQHEESFT